MCGFLVTTSKKKKNENENNMPSHHYFQAQILLRVNKTQKTTTMTMTTKTAKTTTYDSKRHLLGNAVTSTKHLCYLQLKCYHDTASKQTTAATSQDSLTTTTRQTNHKNMWHTN